MDTQKKVEVFRIAFQTLLLIIIATLILFKVNPSEEPTTIYPRAFFSNKAYIDSVKVQKTKLEPGDKIKFEAKWFFRSSLPQGSLVAYYIFDKTGKIITFKDKPQTSSGEGYLATGDGGKIIRDQIELTLPTTITKGAYEVSTYIYPPADWEFTSTNGDSTIANHPLLFSFEVE